MFKVRFRLPADRETVQVVIYSKGEQIVMSAEKTCKHSDWKDGFPKQTNATKILRDQLENLKEQILKQAEIKQAEKGRNLSKDEVKQVVRVIVGGESPKYLYDHFNEFIAYEKSTKASRTVDKKEPQIQAFFDYAGKTLIDDQINKELIENYKINLGKKGLEISTINTYLKNLISYFNWLFDREKTTLMLSRYVKKLPEIDKQVVSLSLEELEQLEQLEMYGRYERVKDLFLFGCYSAMRFDDIQNFNRAMVSGNVIDMKQAKTSTDVVIPIIKRCQAILQKYNYELPQISNQKANEYLKDIFEEGEFFRMVDVTPQHYGNGKSAKRIFKPLHEVITFHASRKTFASVGVALGIPAKTVQAITGHKTDSIFNRYHFAHHDHLVTEMAKMDR